MAADATIPVMQGSILGNAVKRVEDPRFIKGEGRFIDDMVPDDCVFLVPVRSTIAHGEILSIAYAGDGQHQDTGGKVVHAAPHTTSTIVSK